MEKFKGFDNINLKEKTAVCLGNFDGLHIGHRHIIETLKNQADKNGKLKTLIFTLYPHPLKFFGKNIPLLSTPRKREELFEATDVDYLIVADFTAELANLAPQDFFKQIIVDKLNAKIIVVGNDYRFGAKKTGDINLMQELGDQYGIKCIFVEKIKDDNGQIVSSTRIRHLLQVGNVKQAKEFLTRPYSLEGIIIHGDGKGKLFGFPTINQAVTNEIIPALGVYATKTYIKNKLYHSMTYIGKRPTLSSAGEIRVETNIFDFDEDVYGEFSEVFFHEFIRGEMKFNGVDELKTQMARDMASVKNMINKNQGNK